MLEYETKINTIEELRDLAGSHGAFSWFLEKILSWGTIENATMQASNGDKAFFVQYGVAQFDACIDWKRIEDWDWVRILQKRPELADKCDKWKQFTKDHWKRILECQPCLADRIEDWDAFDRNDWQILLQSQPSLAKYCDKWDKLLDSDWEDILRKHPHLSIYREASHA